MSNGIFVGVGMEKFHLIYIFMPFVLGSILCLFEKVFLKNILLLKIFSSLILMIVAGCFSYYFSFLGAFAFDIDWEILHYPGFVFGIKIEPFGIFFSIVNSILLFLTIIFLGSKKQNGGPSGVFIAFVLTGLANCAFMAKSLYTFFILSEMIFFIHYFCCCQIYPKEKLVFMRILNTFAAIVLFGAMLYMAKEGHGLMEFFESEKSSLNMEKIGVFSSIVIYFIIKLFFFPFVGEKSKDNGSLNVVNNVILENTVLMLFVYKFKKYIIDIFPVELTEDVSSIMLVFVGMSCAICALLSASKSFLRKKVLTKHALICLMLGAFFSFNVDVDRGIFILLTCSVFCMVALYFFFDGKYSSSKKFSNKEMLLLAIILCSLMFFPFSGNFIGFLKILWGYKSVQPYFLFLIFPGLMFLFMSWSKEFFLLMEEGFAEKRFLSISSIALVSICLLIIFFIGLNPMMSEYLMQGRVGN